MLGLAAFAGGTGNAAEDNRAWQHGIDLVRVGGRLLLVWGSPGNPPRANPDGAWQHDVYYAWLDSPAAPIEPNILVSLPEAQEPPSVAVNARGTILMTAEDGNGGINQHAGLWDSSLRVLRKYPITIRRGGHSGHAAAMGNRFLVAYGQGWVAGGGWRGLGTGQSIYARIVNDDGTLRRERRLSAGSASGSRDSWPLVAASDRNWLVVWQTYPALALQSALIDARGRIAARGRIIGGLPLRYAYDVEFSPQLAAYVVAGASGDGGFVALVNLRGKVVRTWTGLPPMAAESRLVLGTDGTEMLGVYPVNPQGVAVLRLSARAVELVELIDHPHVWDYSGTSGAFLTPRRVLFVTLSRAGVQVIPVDLPRR